MATFFTLKDPNAVLDYAIDWTNWLGTDALQSSSWFVPAAISVVFSTLGTATTTIWMSGGVLGEVYNVTNRVITTGGRTEDRSIQFTMVDR